jgi:hypothetical protein
MNNRIQALINQSWQTVEGAPREGMEDIRQALMEDLNPVFLEFARLIVRECAVWMDNATVTDSAGNKDYIGDSFFWANELKKHFGVEE